MQGGRDRCGLSVQVGDWTSEQRKLLSAVQPSKAFGEAKDKVGRPTAAASGLRLPLFECVGLPAKRAASQPTCRAQPAPAASRRRASPALALHPQFLLAKLWLTGVRGHRTLLSSLWSMFCR
jgi:hypothetical protein